MGVDVVLQGATYPDVPTVMLPIQGGGTAPFYHDLRWGVLRQDAEVCKTWSYDFMAVADKELTIPAYSTTAKTVLASEALSDDTYTIDYTNYNYYMLQRMLAIPTYSITTKGKGRVEYWLASYGYECVEVPASTYHALVDTTKYYTSATRAFYATGAWYRSMYYSSSSTFTAYSTTAYSTAMAVVAPTYSSGTLTVNTPNLTMRGNSTYFVNTYWNAITDIRYQWVCELYRVPKAHLNHDGWGIAQQSRHIADCINNNLKLT